LTVLWGGGGGGRMGGGTGRVVMMKGSKGSGDISFVDVEENNWQKSHEMPEIHNEVEKSEVLMDIWSRYDLCCIYIRVFDHFVVTFRSSKKPENPGGFKSSNSALFSLYQVHKAVYNYQHRCTINLLPSNYKRFESARILSFK
jgi:hypothetical protein